MTCIFRYTVLYMTEQRKIIVQAFLPPACLFLFNLFIDSGLHLYAALPGLDIPMHFIGGYMIAVAAMQILDAYKKSAKIKLEPAIIRSLFLVGTVAVVAFLWEGYEWAHDQFFPRAFQLGTADMLGDIAIGLIGACAYSFVLCLPTEKIPLAPRKKPAKKQKKKRK